MEPTAPKVLSRYLRGPSASCHDHCKCEIKPTTETKAIHPFLKRIPKLPADKPKLEPTHSIPRIKKSTSVIPKVTTRNTKTNNVVKDQTLKRDVFKVATKNDAIEAKTRDLKPKPENPQAKTSRTSRRRHSDLFLPIEDIPLPSSTTPKRRLSDVTMHPPKHVASVSNRTLLRGSSTNKNELSRKESKLPVLKKKYSAPPKLSVSSPKRNTKVPPLSLRSNRSLPKLEFKSPRKSKPMKPTEEKTLPVMEPKIDIETTETISHISPVDSLSSEEKVLIINGHNELQEPDPSFISEEIVVITNGHNDLQEFLPLMEDDTAATYGQNDDIVADSEVNDVKEDDQNDDNVADSEVDDTKEEVQNIDNVADPEVNDTKEDGQNDESVADSEVNDTKEDGQNDENVTGSEFNDTKEDGQNDENVADSEVNVAEEDGQNDDNVVDSEEETSVGKLVVETRDSSLEDLRFRRGTITSSRSENTSPIKLQFLQGSELGGDQTEQTEKKILRRLSTDCVIRLPETHSISVDLKHQEVQEKKDGPGLFNNVIEETASKLIQARRSKVKALVGAFETIVTQENVAPLPSRSTKL